MRPVPDVRAHLREGGGGHPDITFGKVDTEAQQELAASFQIRSIPTLMILRDQVLLFSQPGALPEAALEDLIRQVRALDMEKVRAEIAAQESSRRRRRGPSPALARSLGPARSPARLPSGRRLAAAGSRSFAASAAPACSFPGSMSDRLDN